MAQKPPMGIVLREKHDEHRLTELRDCIQRHIDDRYPLQFEWIVEYNELVTRYKN